MINKIEYLFMGYWLCMLPLQWNPIHSFWLLLVYFLSWLGEVLFIWDTLDTNSLWIVHTVYILSCCVACLSLYSVLSEHILFLIYWMNQFKRVLLFCVLFKKSSATIKLCNIFSVLSLKFLKCLNTAVFLNVLSNFSNLLVKALGFSSRQSYH